MNGPSQATISPTTALEKLHVENDAIIARIAPALPTIKKLTPQLVTDRLHKNDLNRLAVAANLGGETFASYTAENLASWKIAGIYASIRRGNTPEETDLIENFRNDVSALTELYDNAVPEKNLPETTAAYKAEYAKQCSSWSKKYAESAGADKPRTHLSIVAAALVFATCRNPVKD